jgi:hemerythrin-like domain-containing protein
MLRDKNLIPLSHQHQHALALCVRLERAAASGQLDLEAWQAEIQQLAEQEIGVHFDAEEKELFPAAARFPEMKPLVRDLLEDHKALRDYFAQVAARTLDHDGLRAFAERLSAHVRKEERQLFEEVQKRMAPEELAKLGAALNKALEAASNACILPSAATRLLPKKSNRPK